MSKRKRIHFTAWTRADLSIPAYTLSDPDGFELPSTLVARAIARKNKLCAVVLRPDCSVVNGNGKVTSQHFQLTLGKPAHGGGWTPVATVWFSVP